MAESMPHVETEQEPQLALGVTIERTIPGLPSIAEVASVIGALTDVFVAASRPSQRLGPGVSSLALLEYEGKPLIVSGGGDGALRSWHPDGQPGPLNVPNAHGLLLVSSLAVVDYRGEPLIVSGGADGALRSWRLDGRRGPLNVPRAHVDWVWSLVAVEYIGDSLIVSGGGDGALRSWHPDGQPGPLNVRAHAPSVSSLAVLWYEGGPLIVSGGGDGTLRSSRLDGRPGPLNVPRAHVDWVWSLVAVEYIGDSLIVSGGADGALRSWQPDGQPGPLNVAHAHASSISSLVVLEEIDDLWIREVVIFREWVIVSGGGDGTLRSCRMDGHPGPLSVVAGSPRPRGQRSPRPRGQSSAWMSFGTRTAAQLQVQRLYLASPLELTFLIPAALLTTRAFGFVLYAIKRLWGFPLEIRVYRESLRAQLLKAEQECQRLEMSDVDVADKIEPLAANLPDGWEITDAEVVDAYS